MNEDKKFAHALCFAAAKHCGQTYDDGPYIFHPIRVAMRLQDPRERIIAVLHDVVEDTNATLEEVKELVDDSEVYAAIVLLTNSGNDYDSYIKAITENAMATHVKRADLEENISMSFGLDMERRDKCLRKWHKALHVLSECSPYFGGLYEEDIIHKTKKEKRHG